MSTSSPSLSLRYSATPKPSAQGHCSQRKRAVAIKTLASGELFKVGVTTSDSQEERVEAVSLSPALEIWKLFLSCIFLVQPPICPGPLFLVAADSMLPGPLYVQPDSFILTTLLRHLHSARTSLTALTLSLPDLKTQARTSYIHLRA